MGLITEHLDVKAADRIMERIDNVAGATQEELDTLKASQETMKTSQETIKAFVDMVEPTQVGIQATQADIEAAQAAMQAAQVIMQNAQAVLQSGQVATHNEIDQVQEKMAETLLPLTGEEIPEQHNPITLMELPQYIYWNESEHPFQFGGGTLKRVSGSWLNGEEVIVLIQTKESGGWATIWDEKFSEPVDFEKKKLPEIYNDGSGLRISIKQKFEGDGYHMWNYSFISAERTE